MEGGSKKLTLEERLSLAAAKGKRKTKKQGTGSPAQSPTPIDLTNKQSNEISNAIVLNEPKEENENADDNSKLSQSSATDIALNGEYYNDDKDTFLNSLRRSKPWSSWLPADIHDLSSVELLKVLEPHIKEMVKQNMQPPKIDNSASSLVKVIKEKEEIISQLRQEGENLSKTELRLSTNNKALRKQVSDLEEQIVVLQEELFQKVNALEKASVAAEDSRIQIDELQNQLNELKQENANSKLLEEKLAQTKDRLNQSQNLLDAKNNDFKEEKSKWQKDKESLTSTTREQILLLESNLEQLRIELETSKQGASVGDDGDHWKEQYTVLRNELQDSRQNWNALEEALNTRLTSLEGQLDEARKAEKALTSKLSASDEEKKDLYAKLEKATNERGTVQHELKELRDENKALQRSLEDLTDDFKLLQKQYNIQKTHLERKIDSSEEREEKPSLPLDEDEPPVHSSNFEDEWILPSMISSISHSDAPIELKDKLNNVDYESVKSVTELEKERLELDMNDIPNEASDLGSLSKLGISRQHSSSVNIRNKSDAPASNQMSAQMVGKLASEIRRFEVEVSSLKSQCERVQKEKNSTNNELVRLMEENESLKKLELEKCSLSKEVENLQSKLETSLQLLGEKAERAEELENDVQDLKDMMKQQIQDMMDLREANH